MDVLGASAASHQLAWWKNEGGDPVVWTKQIITTGFTGARSVDAFDIDSDGDIDVAGAALLSNEVAWWRNDGGNPIVWTKMQLANDFILSHKIQIVDIDKDLAPDLLATAYNPGQIAWWKNEGGDPVNWTKYTVNSSFGGAVIGWSADFDMDGDMDVAGSAQGSGQVAWWSSDGAFPYGWTKHPVETGFDEVWPLYYGDLDGDHDLDLVAGGNEANQVHWYENSRYGIKINATPKTGHAPIDVNFADSSLFDLPVSGWAWDFDNDGIIDSYEQHPSHTFDMPGDYDVSLQITTAKGSYSRTFDGFVKVFNGQSALEFNGANSRVVIEDSPTLNLVDDFTIECWIKPYSYGEVPGYGLGRIADKSYISLFLVNGYVNYVDACLSVTLKHEDNSQTKIYTDENTIALNTWQHIALVFKADDVTGLYIDGAEQAINVISTGSGPVKENTFNDLLIGNVSHGAWTFDGVIDELRIWDHVRTEQEILENRFKELSGDENGFLGYWKMDEGNGTILLDGSGQNEGAIEESYYVSGYPLDPLVWINESGSAENTSTVFKIFPNPATKKTNCSFSLEEVCNIELRIYDHLGKVVQVSGKRNYMPGNHNIDLLLPEIPGIYMATALIDEKAITQKIVVMP